MSQELKKRVEDNTVIYENDECKVVFSSSVPPNIDDYQVAMTTIDKRTQGVVMVHWTGREWRRMLLDMGIKTTDPRV